MSDLKVLPQKAYSLKDAVQYVESEYNVLLDERKLLNYMKEGDLTASIHIEGNKKRIEYIDFLDKEIKVFPEESFLTIKNSKDKLLKTGDTIYGTNVYDKHNMTNISFCINDKNVNVMDKIENISFKDLSLVRYSGYFRITRETLFFNIDDLPDNSFLLPPVINFVSNDSSIHIKLASTPEKIKLGINNICILHEDLMDFLNLKLKNETNLNLDNCLYLLGEVLNAVKSKNRKWTQGAIIDELLYIRGDRKVYGLEKRTIEEYFSSANKRLEP